MRWARRGLVMVVTVLSLAGCQPGGSAAASPAATESSAAQPAATPVLTHLRTAQELKDAIAAERGKLVVVNFWATWCGPCVAEFPALVRLRDAYRDRGLVLITVSADFPDAVEEKVLPFLAEHHVTDHAFLQDADDENAFIQDFSSEWRGSLPATFVYDTAGTQVEFLTGEQTYEAFEAAVRPHLP